MAARLMNRVAIVTGAASGMGSAIVRRFAEEGANVYAVDLAGDQREAAVASLLPGSPNVSFIAADVSIQSDMEACIDRVVRQQGRLDILFNNAGYNLVKTVEATTDEEYNRCMDVNLRAVFLACRLVIPIMKAQRSGVILSTSSSAGIIGRPSLPLYAASKGGVVMFSKSLALALGAYGIRVNCICPGSIATPMFNASMDAMPDPESARNSIAETCCLKRIGEASDIANAALFLASDEASFITGVALPVDGGRTAGVQEAQGVFDVLAAAPVSA